MQKSSGFNPFVFVGSNSQATVALSEGDTLEEPNIELAGSLVSTPESGADETDPQSELRRKRRDYGECKLIRIHKTMADHG